MYPFHFKIDQCEPKQSLHTVNHNSTKHILDCVCPLIGESVPYSEKRSSATYCFLAHSILLNFLT